MGREVKRVPVDFDWPTDKVWEGFLMPDRLHEAECESCEGSGYSPEAKALADRWYGYAPFDPSETGSERLTPDTPAVRAFAERNVSRASEFYGTDPGAIRREATRLAGLWNTQWCHHLSQDDVDALVESGRLTDFTSKWTRESGWQPIDPRPVVTAAEVNLWSLTGFGHDAINRFIVVEARCKRDGVSDTCAECGGHGSTEKYPGQRAEAEAWGRTEPPTGDGWQLWETVSEGSPISPVFADREGLIGWLMSPAYTWGTSRPLTREQAEAFTASGWAPTFIASAATGLINGEQMLPAGGAA